MKNIDWMEWQRKVISEEYIEEDSYYKVKIKENTLLEEITQKKKTSDFDTQK
ncbi:hypothetical protein [Bacillus infantis]|uniref:hypothetical protein n=1 Tax=Bacillus infantis TaxID=324767 RepID=UPI001653C8C3|nr:hypothetical protein [Bacillus infantis]